MFSELNESGYRLLGFLAANSTRDHSLHDINVGLSFLIPTTEIRAILNVFHQEGYITMLFTVDDILDLDSKAENRFKITPQGETFYLEQQGFRKYGQQALTDLEDDNPEASDEKRKNRNRLIAFALIMLIAITTVILVNL